jgi:hypothetical protein
MTDFENAPNVGDLSPENKERVNSMAREIMEPALQAALAEGVKKAPEVEVVSALASAYSAFLIEILGRKAASSFMRGQADHIVSREDVDVTDGEK